jgi:hypothetical protein
LTGFSISREWLTLAKLSTWLAECMLQSINGKIYLAMIISLMAVICHCGMLTTKTLQTHLSRILLHLADGLPLMRNSTLDLPQSVEWRSIKIGPLIGKKLFFFFQFQFHAKMNQGCITLCWIIIKKK